MTPAARRAAAAQLIHQYRMSRVRACRLAGLSRSSLNYRPRRPDDSAVRERLRESAAERRRFGYRRLGWLLAREGHVMNRSKLYRIYREEKLMVRRSGRRKRDRHARSARFARCGQSSLVARLRLGRAGRRTALSRPLRGRRLQPRMPGLRGRHFDRRACAWCANWNTW